MASTRNRNTPGDYQSEQAKNTDHSAYFSYEHSSHYAVPTQTHFPGNGLIGMKSAHRNLSQNYCDIESQLFGIGSTNLVSPQGTVDAHIHTLKSLNIADKTPLILPAPLVAQPNQRPMYLN
jgi:hypothetical protein